MNSLQFKENEHKIFCSIIGYKTSEIENISSNLKKYYYEKVENKTDKKTGDLKRYLDGTPKTRILHPSIEPLKSIQKSIKKNILEPIILPDVIHGGVKKRSNVTNAKPHKGNKYKFTTDLQSFYPSIEFKRVNQTFLKLGFSNHFSHWLTKLTTWKYKLPQGTPTSTHISNLVFLETDYKLIRLCNENNITYTRYIDDLTFSSQQDFKHLLSQILQIVLDDNFRISYRKTKYKGNQTITGIDVFLHKIDAPKHIKEKAYLELKNNLEKKPYWNYLNQIKKADKRKKKQL